MGRSEEEQASDRDLACGLLAVRSWKRDGSKNWLSLERAAENLCSYAEDPHIRAAGVQGIRIRLVAGQALATPLALFRMA